MPETLNRANEPRQSGPSGAPPTADAWNRDCSCRTLDAGLLRRQIARDDTLPGLADSLQRTHPYLFASTAVFVSRAMLGSLQAAVSAIEHVVALPEYQAMALARAPAIARHAFGPSGVFMSCDFHLGAEGPKLIEINTNAGGALLNAILARAQQSCCEAMAGATHAEHRSTAPEEEFVAMFRREWHRQRGMRPPGRLLIVDDAPADQHLAPEFELFRRLFVRHGIECGIADARDLVWADGRLAFGDGAVDMVYNRLTDFYLDESRHEALRRAYESGAVVLTPHPRAHALYADKRNLVALSDDALLARWNVAARDRALLASAVPHTCLVTAENADHLWADRRRLFFKPFTGFGARGAYRGDKLTRRVWKEILAGGYIAQEFAPPTERALDVDGVPENLKFDLRAYTYEGRIQLLAARLYRGQTTNMRTPGGGFAPVVILEA